ncbi:OmpA family protein [Rivibacter subsaxonicus]|uniref:Peptidoglycan-associated protein n=1 Tax=Rivibacter subsaxonicus TaxID=457575 RepID=A0A4Q7W2T1_9BURK|nr:OmpA family protein [Rivibacter subsaxonicus]RZU03039.1 peptidoglycan-associated lipoprotein [Rivibacter subsaxonicus]
MHPTLSIRRFAASGLAIAAALALAACSSPVKLDEQVPVETRSTTPSGSGNGSAGGAPASQVGSVDLSAQDPGAKFGRVILFDFDAYVVKDEFRPLVEGYAKALNADRKKNIVIEGHTDDRGSREYNLALGQRRSEAVVRALTLLGVQPNQAEPVSYGKERPVDPAQNEAAWAKNRRAELRSK